MGPPPRRRLAVGLINPGPSGCLLKLILSSVERMCSLSLVCILKKVNLCPTLTVLTLVVPTFERL